MTTLHASHLVRAPIDRVWAVFTDIPAAPQMMSGVTAVQVLSDGPFGPGYRWRETRTMMGRSATEEMSVAEADAPHSYAVVAASRGTDYRSVFTFTEVPGGTEVALAFSGTPTNLLTRLLDLALSVVPKGPIVRGLQQDLVELAAVAERPA
jgi:uncharacterized membrane protein